MDLNEVYIEGYRSIRSIRFPVRRLTVFVGNNGVGKTNLYRSLQLVHAAAVGNFASELAEEGGLPSALWAGKRRNNEAMKLQFSVKLDDIYFGSEDRQCIAGPTYSFDVGYPPRKAHAAFPNEAELKTESFQIKAGRRDVAMMERKNKTVFVRDDHGKRMLVEEDLLASETALSRLGTTATFPEITAACRAISQWRFYHSFRTDQHSALRRPCAAITSPMLHSDGSNLAAVFATLRHIREDSFDLDAAINDAFPGSKLIVKKPEDMAHFSLTYPDFPNREFSAKELSDGTLQYLALMGALLSYRLPPFLALNEPEGSLHPSLLPALGRLIARSAERAQILVVTHSAALASAIEDETGIIAREVIREDGATWLEGLSPIGIFRDEE